MGFQVQTLQVVFRHPQSLGTRWPADLLCCHVSQGMVTKATMTAPPPRLCPGVNHPPCPPPTPDLPQEVGRAGPGVLLGHPVDGDLARCSPHWGRGGVLFHQLDPSGPAGYRSLKDSWASLQGSRGLGALQVSCSTSLSGMLLHSSLNRLTTVWLYFCKTYW